MAAFPTTVATDSDLYIAVNATSTQLTDNPLSNSATTVNVTSTAAFPTVGFISIDNEIIKYTGKTGTSFTGCTRGADGTSATSHVQNSQVFHNVIAAHHNVLKDEIIPLEQYLSDRFGLTANTIAIPNGITSVTRTRSTAGVTSEIVISHTDNTNGASNAKEQITSGGASGGDPYTVYTISGQTSFAIGIDNSANDRFKISNSSNLGTADRFILDATGWAAVGPNATYTANFFGLRTDAAENAAFWARVNNASGDPFIQFTTNSTDWVLGADNSASDNFTISASSTLGTTDWFRMSTNGSTAWLGTSWSHTSANVGGTNTLLVENTDTGSTSSMRISLKVPSGAGDSYIFWDGPSDWSLGLDNSDGDKWQLCRQTGVGGNVKWSMHTDGRFALGTANPEAYNSNADDFVVSNSAGTVGITLRSNTNNSCVIAFTDAEGTTIQGLLQYDHNATAANEKLSVRVGGTDIIEFPGAGVRHVQTSSFTATDGTNSFTVGTIEMNAIVFIKGYALIFISGQFTTGGTVTGSLLRVGGIGTIANQYNLVNAGTITGYGHGLVTTNSGTDPRALLSPVIASSSTLGWQRANSAAWSASTVYNFHCTVLAAIA